MFALLGFNIMGMFGLVGLAYTNEAEHGLFMLNYPWSHNDIFNNNIKDRTRGLTNNNIKAITKGLTNSNSGTSGLKNNKTTRRGLINSNINKSLNFER